MGSVMGVTVPTLHVGMLFTSSCWYRDPHGLPWIEYLHTGIYIYIYIVCCLPAVVGTEIHMVYPG